MVNQAQTIQTDVAVPQPRPFWRRFAPLAILAIALAVLVASGAQAGLGLDALAMNYKVLADWVVREPVLASLFAFFLYAAATAISFPAAWLLTVALGLLFGWLWASVIVVFGATAGAAGIFLATRLAFADFFRARAGGWVKTLAEGFNRDAFSYMLFLRLVPAVPFVVVNVVPAIVGVPLRIFALSTLVGIVPGVIAYAFAGEGLRSIIADRAAACAANAPPCGMPLSASSLVTPEVIIALVLLSVLSLLPVVVRRLRRHKA
jgi:uncharacterized membrane protein YdjX (TVP38/TMEM64 family)